MNVSSVSVESHSDYQPMLDAVRTQFAQVRGPLFTTNIDGSALWSAWLGGLPEAERQHHNCNACRRFVEQYGGLVTIDDAGETTTAMIGRSAGIYAEAFDRVRDLVGRARITGVFVSSAPVWGLPSNRDRKHGCVWQHMHVVPPDVMRWRGAVLDAGQRAAELAQDYQTLCRALAEFKVENVRQALAIAEGDTLYRSEKVAGRLRWLVDLYEKRADRRHRDNLTWLAIATAPAGFCHVRSSVVGSLLEELEDGRPFAEVKRAFDAKMHPLQYQRPTAPPSAGNIKQADEIIARLGSAGSLQRRFARLDDVRALWIPPAKKEPKLAGVFGHLLASPAASTVAASGPRVTWAKFAATILPSAEAIAVRAPEHGNYTAFVTASNHDAPPLIQWDSEDVRNPVSWYTYSNGSPASKWGLRGGAYVTVTAVAAMPNMWQDGFAHHGAGVLLILDGCRDVNGSQSGCLFPELLKSEYHSIRATIEAHSRSMRLEGAAEAGACGVTVRAGSPTPVMVRVTSRGTVTDYTIDRWD